MVKRRQVLPEDFQQLLDLIKGKLFALQDWIKVSKRLLPPQVAHPSHPSSPKDAGCQYAHWSRRPRPAAIGFRCDIYVRLALSRCLAFAAFLRDETLCRRMIVFPWARRGSRCRSSTYRFPVQPKLR